MPRGKKGKTTTLPAPAAVHQVHHQVTAIGGATRADNDEALLKSWLPSLAAHAPEF